MIKTIVEIVTQYVMLPMRQTHVAQVRVLILVILAMYFMVISSLELEIATKEDTIRIVL